MATRNTKRHEKVAKKARWALCLPFGVFLCFLWPLLLLSAQDSKPLAVPNTLTAQQVRRGEVLLFDGESILGWTITGEARVENGVLVLGGTKETVAEPNLRLTGHAVAFQTDWAGEKPPLVMWNSAIVPRFLLSRPEQGKWTEQFSSTRGKEVAVRLVRFRVPVGSTLRLRNVKALPMGLRPIFNGKDLSGWKEPAYKQ
jgi:hypothetical protein